MNSNSDMQLRTKYIPILIAGFLFASGWVFTGCQQTVYFDIDTQENRLVVNGFIQPGTDADLRVTLSQDPLAIGFEDVVVEDAIITLYRNNDIAGTFEHTGSGVYILDAASILAAPGDVISLTAEAEGRTTVTTSTVIPTEVPISACYISDTILEPISYSAYDSLGNVIIIDTVVPYYEIKVSFEDPAGKDRYMFNVQYDDVFGSTSACFSSDEPSFALEDYNVIGTDESAERITYCYEVIFSDITFDGELHTITILVYAIDTTFTTDPKYLISLKHVSEEYYQYYTTSRAQDVNGDNPFSTPVVVFSNIENGFGIFAGFTEKISTILL